MIEWFHSMEPLQPLEPQAQPQSVHGHHQTHPAAVAVVAILAPVLFALLLGGVYMITKISPVSPIGVAEASVAPSQVLNKYEVKNAVERQAVCNDGSPAVYYFREGRDENADKWVIYKETGGSCSDEASCAARLQKEPHRVSSKNYPPVIAQKGMLSHSPETNPEYWNYNHVYIKYCSSDNWAEDTTRVINGQEIPFRGLRILPAVFEDLGINETTTIIYAD